MARSFIHRDSAHRHPGIERRSVNGTLMVAMIILIALVAAIAFFLFQQEAREQRQSDAVVTAAQSVGDAAKDAVRAVNEMAHKVSPKD